MRKFIDIVEQSLREGMVAKSAGWYTDRDWRPSDTMMVFHGTSSVLLESILANGINDPNHWGSRPVAEHFANGACNDHGGEPVIIGKKLISFSHANFETDFNMIDFAVFDAETLDERIAAWRDSEQGWQDSLHYYEAIVYSLPVDVDQADILPPINRHPTGR